MVIRAFVVSLLAACFLADSSLSISLEYSQKHDPLSLGREKSFVDTDAHTHAQLSKSHHDSSKPRDTLLHRGNPRRHLRVGGVTQVAPSDVKANITDESNINGISAWDTKHSSPSYTGDGEGVFGGDNHRTIQHGHLPSAWPGARTHLVRVGKADITVVFGGFSPSWNYGKSLYKDWDLYEHIHYFYNIWFPYFYPHADKHWKPFPAYIEPSSNITTASSPSNNDTATGDYENRDPKDPYNPFEPVKPTWISSDRGSNWNTFTNFPWYKRFGWESVDLPNGKIIAVGGATRDAAAPPLTASKSEWRQWASDQAFHNDVIFTSDGGKSWDSYKGKKNEWADRIGHSLASQPYGSKRSRVWMVGGISNPKKLCTDASSLTKLFLRDVQYSESDGETWEERVYEAPFPGRAFASLAVLAHSSSGVGSLFVVGGLTLVDGATVTLGDVWQSKDGGHKWSEVSAITPFSLFGHRVLVYSGALAVYGGLSLRSPWVVQPLPSDADDAQVFEDRNACVEMGIPRVDNAVEAQRARYEFRHPDRKAGTRAEWGRPSHVIWISTDSGYSFEGVEMSPPKNVLQSHNEKRHKKEASENQQAHRPRHSSNTSTTFLSPPRFLEQQQTLDMELMEKSPTANPTPTPTPTRKAVVSPTTPKPTSGINAQTLSSYGLDASQSGSPVGYNAILDGNQVVVLGARVNDSWSDSVFYAPIQNVAGISAMPSPVFMTLMAIFVALCFQL